MKKTLVACLAVVALFALAAGASAITCTTDQRPAATLLVPYFQATFNTDGTIDSGPTSLDTLVTIGNASSVPMLAHVNVFNERSELVLDFNVALTGFDIQSWSMASILRGFLPQTPVNQSHVSNVKDSHQVTLTGDVCQRNASAPFYPNAGGYLRENPVPNPATGSDNTLATTQYSPGPFSSGFLFGVLDSLDTTADSRICGGVDGVITNPIHGYVVIDHANYCNLSNPADPSGAYYTNDAIGMENNLFGDYIFTSAAGLGTIGFPAVAIEADPTLADGAVPPSTTSVRTFYRRYVTAADTVGGCPLNPAIFVNSPWNCGLGDQREPLGLKYAARWFDGSTPPSGGVPTATTSFFNVWRASSGTLTDLLDGGSCDTVEPTVTLTFFDEDENTVTGGTCPSPCTSPTQNFPFETQRTGIGTFTHPAWPAGWVNMAFLNTGTTGTNGGVLDQAYVTYDFQGALAFLSAGVTAAQLDPSECNPLGVIGPPVITPVIPAVVGTGS